MEEIKQFISSNRISEDSTLIRRNAVLSLLELCKKNNVGVWSFTGYKLVNSDKNMDDFYRNYSDSDSLESLELASSFFENHIDEDIGYLIVLKDNSDSHVEEIKKFIHRNSIYGYNMKLIYKDDFLKLLEKIENSKAEILGFDVFHLLGNGNVRPDAKLTVDLSTGNKEEKDKKIKNYLELNDYKNIGFEVYLK